MLNCIEYPIPIAVRLLREGEDIVFLDAIELRRRDFIIVGNNSVRQNVTAYFPKLTDADSMLNTAGTALIAEEFTSLKSNDNIKSHHHLKSTSLEYKVYFPHEDVSDVNSQLFDLEHNTYSLLIEFLGEAYAIVRSGKFRFTSKYATGGMECNIEISAPNTLQYITEYKTVE